ncbi:MAG: Oxidoreductase [Caeruleum heppii]|nr:MAG: Oxidoreductase [Caeruleum heppii]
MRPAARPVLRRSLGAPLRIAPRLSLPSRALLHTSPPAARSRSWKSTALRWSLAVGGIYYYNTSNVFAEEPAHTLAHLPPHDDDSSSPQTLEVLAAEKRRRATSGLSDDEQSPLAATTTSLTDEVAHGVEPPETAQEMEDEADSQGAFNPETGEINWDCPCLGGMAHGPCGEEFRAAFSCFVYSKEEPKGMDCIDRFKGMQDCFRQHPDVYGSELDEDEEDLDQDFEREPHDNSAASEVPSPPQSSSRAGRAGTLTDDEPNKKPGSTDFVTPNHERARQASKQAKETHEPQSDRSSLVPKPSHGDNKDQS